MILNWPHGDLTMNLNATSAANMLAAEDHEKNLVTTYFQSYEQQ